jgi:hypothetical protein
MKVGKKKEKKSVERIATQELIPHPKKFKNK